MIEPQKLVFIIVNRGEVKRLVGLLNASGFTYHTAVLGHGTAPTEMQAYFGLGETEKVLLMSFCGESRTAELFALLHEKMELDRPNGGIAFSVRLSGIAGMSALQFVADHE